MTPQEIVQIHREMTQDIHDAAAKRAAIMLGPCLVCLMLALILLFLASLSLPEAGPFTGGQFVPHTSIPAL